MRTIKLAFTLLISCCSVYTGYAQQTIPSDFSITDAGYFYKPGLNFLVFNSHYGLFGDEKLSGIEIIHHETRTATNGDVRLNPTPEQWDSIPQFIKREVNRQSNSIEAFLHFISTCRQ